MKYFILIESIVFKLLVKKLNIFNTILSFQILKTLSFIWDFIFSIKHVVT